MIYKEDFKMIKNIDKLFAWIILLFMPLSTHGAFTNGITIGDVSLFVFFIILILIILLRNDNLKNIISIPLLIYGIFILFYSLLLHLLKGYETINILSLGRYLLYIFVVVLGAKNFINDYYTINLYIRLAIIFSFYLIIQYLSYYVFGIILPNGFPGMPNALTSIPLEEYIAKPYLLYRPSSVFIEPAHFAAYIIPALYILINSEQKYIKEKMFYSLLLTLSLIISGSSTAIIMLTLCWIKPIFKMIRNLNIKSSGFLVFLGGMIIYLFSLDYTQRATSRMFGDHIFSSESAFYGRFGNYLRLTNDFSIIERTFGLGFGYKYNYYLPSYGTLVLYMGYLGLAVFLSIMLYTYIKSSKTGKDLILLSLILFTGTNSLFGIASVLYFTLIYSEIGIGIKK